MDLDGARRVREAARVHTASCPCPLCANWTRVRDIVLPTELQAQMRRAGIDPADPEEIWAYDARADRVAYHLVYYTAGRVMSGPPSWVSDPSMGKMQSYRWLRGEPYALGMMVTHPGPHDADPPWLTPEMAPLVIVDFRLDVPWLLEERPEGLRIDPAREAPRDNWRRMGSRGQRRWRRRFQRYMAEVDPPA